jgi:hypothetical protein
VTGTEVAKGLAKTLARGGLKSRVRTQQTSILLVGVRRVPMSLIHRSFQNHAYSSAIIEAVHHYLPPPIIIIIIIIIDTQGPIKLKMPVKKPEVATESATPAATNKASSGNTQLNCHCSAGC